MPYDMYKQLVGKGEDDFWNRLDDLLHGYIGNINDALRLIDAAAARIRAMGYVVDANTQHDLDLFVSGYKVARVTRFLERENLNDPAAFMSNVILLFTLAYLGDIPTKMIPNRPPTRVYLETEAEVEAFFLGDRHETSMVN